MTFPNLPFNTGVPDGPNNPSDDQPDMEENNVSANAWAMVDHVGFNVPNSGIHNVIHFNNQLDDPSVNANFGQLYSKTNSGELFFRNNLGVITQLTGNISPSPSTNGYTTLPGGLILQWGIVAPNGFGNATIVNLPLTFPNNIFSITISIVADQGNTPDTNNIFVKQGTVTTSSFRLVNTTSNLTKLVDVYWMAIGN